MSINDIISSQLDDNTGQCAVCGKSICAGCGHVQKTHHETTVLLCCPLCVAAFEKDPDEYVRRLQSKTEVHRIFELLRNKPPNSDKLSEG